jgi:CheY-like chemotaxis protein
MKTWIVVEDEPHIYDLLIAMFELWGINGRAFVDGEEAVAWIERVDRDGTVTDIPELAFIDIRLPGISGAAVGERLRQSRVLREIPIVLTSAYVLDSAELDALMRQSGADAFIRKPLPDFADLKAQLLAIIARRTAEIAARSDAARSDAAPPPTPAPAPTPAAGKAAPTPAAQARQAASHRRYPIYRTPAKGED